MKIFTKKDFKQMPWKNGGGTTCQLFSLDSLLRISLAQVTKSGPFSYFPSMDRHIMLIQGNGMILNFSDKTKTIKKSFDVFSFPGESDIHCQLVDGTISDLNIMINRDWGMAIIENLTSASLKKVNKSLTYIFEYKNSDDFLLMEFGANEEINLPEIIGNRVEIKINLF